MNEDHKVITHLYYHICSLGAPNRKHHNFHHLSPGRVRLSLLSEWGMDISLTIEMLQMI